MNKMQLTSLDTFVSLFVFLGSITETVSNCPSPGIFSNPDDCASFYLCSGFGLGFLRDCPRGTLFDEILQVCNFRESVDCRSRPSEQVVEDLLACPEPGIFANPDDCASFILCLDTDFGTLQNCPEGAFYDENFQTCISGNLVDCGSRPREEITETPVNCPSPGNFPNPNDCSSFFLCSGFGIGALTPCPEGTRYDDFLQICNFLENVDCGLRPTTNVVSLENSNSLPFKVIAIYLALAADGLSQFHSDVDWQPMLYSYQQRSANVLIFTFINPRTMIVPRSFVNLARTRGSNEEGSIPSSTKILFSIGGQRYSSDINPWPWLMSRGAAESMAREVSEWPELYGCDGIDIAIGSGAGDATKSGIHLIHFVDTLRRLVPRMIIHLPVFGWPQIRATNDLVNEAWNVGGLSNGLVDSIGIAAFNRLESLDFVQYYAQGSRFQQEIFVDVPPDNILVGINGTSSERVIDIMTDEIIRQNLRGMIVWYASVRGGFVYDLGTDTSVRLESQNALIKSLGILVR